MKKEIEEMDLSELIQLREVVSSLKNRYAEHLTTYGILNDNIKLSDVSPSEERLIVKHRKMLNLLTKVDNKIEKYIFDNYVE